MATETAYQQRLAVLQLALGGLSGETTDGAHVTFYDRRLAAYLGELVEGGYVLDQRAALRARPGLAVLSPLCTRTTATEAEVAAPRPTCGRGLPG
jgi:hypothetical protein